MFKTFAASLMDKFRVEKRLFEHLQGQEGMIQYVGWFQHQELDDQGSAVAYFTIVLEEADFDLNSAFRGQAPPNLPSEVEGFWESMVEVASALDSIQRLEKDQILYDM